MYPSDYTASVQKEKELRVLADCCRCAASIFDKYAALLEQPGLFGSRKAFSLAQFVLLQ